MRFGLHTGQHHVSFDELADLWSFAAGAGFDACYVFDHFQPLHSEVEEFLPEEATAGDGPCLEGFATLAALARAVPSIGVGMMVAGAGYREPGLLAHMVTTLAQAAPGRLEIGVGAGWFTPEYAAYGYPFPPARERMESLGRALEAVRAVRPRPRLWVAGIGEKRLLPFAARHADSWNAMYLTPEEYGAKVRLLREQANAAGRDAAGIECSIALRAFCAQDSAHAFGALESVARARGRDPERLRARSLCGTPSECAEQLARYANAGATHLAIMVHPPYDRDSLALLAGDLFPQFRGR